MTPRVRVEALICAAIFFVLLGCAALQHRRSAQGKSYAAQWHCEIDAVDAKTGKPVEMRCTDPEGGKFKLRAE